MRDADNIFIREDVDKLRKEIRDYLFGGTPNIDFLTSENVAEHLAPWFAAKIDNAICAACYRVLREQAKQIKEPS